MREDKILEKVQKVEIELLDELDRICKINNIKYFIMYGTLIGAVRHKGFIPWDDDIDVMMLREDFDKFAKVCTSFLGSDFFFQSTETDRSYPDQNTHIRMKGTKYISNHTDDFEFACDGIWLDIWPLDNIGSNELMGGKLRWLVIKTLNRLAYIRAIKTKKHLPTKYKLLFLIVKLFPADLFIVLRDQLSTLNKDSRSEFLINFASPYKFEKELVKREYYSKTKQFEFNKKKYLGPCGYHELLSQIYGDYMTMPSNEERRIYHRPDIVEFK